MRSQPFFGRWLLTGSALLLSCILLLASSGITLAEMGPTAEPDVADAPAFTITPGAASAEGPDFATRKFGDPWDMNNAQDIYLHSSPYCEAPRTFKNSTLAGGIWSGQSLVPIRDGKQLSSPNFWLHFPGYKGGLLLGRDGQFDGNAIDTSVYYKLTLRMYIGNIQQPPSDPQPWDTVRLMWTDGDLGDFANGRCAVSNKIDPVQGWHTYQIDLRALGSNNNGTCSNPINGWTGKVSGLRVMPIADRNDVEVKVDWARLTGDSPVKLPILWANSGSLISLYADTDNNAGNGWLMQIAANQNGLAGALNWDAGGLPPGNYYIYGQTGSDYAGLNLSDPWDMSQAGDVIEKGGINTSFAGGVMTGATTQGGGYINLKVDQSKTINPSIFNKLTFRINVTQPGKHFSVWWQDSDDAWVEGVSNQAHTGSGWTNVTVDLSGNAKWANGKAKKNFRLLPAVQPSVDFQLDWVGLAAGTALTQESQLAAQSSYSAQRVAIKGAPVLKFSKPSMTSGADYATENLGNPWDFDSSADMGSTLNLLNESYTNGVFRSDSETVTRACNESSTAGVWGEPNLNMNMGRPVDSSRFRYLNFRMKLSGDQDVGWGWVSRVYFLQKGYNNPAIPSQPGDHAITNDIVIYEGWNDYTIDMTRSDLYDDEAKSYSTWTSITPTLIRFDPHEIPHSIPTTFEMDSITIHAKDVADQSYSIEWALSNSSGPLTTTLYYSDQAPARSGAAQVLIATLTGGETSYQWNTSAVAEGEYWLKAVVSDGLNSNEWWSNAPLIVDRTPKIQFTGSSGVTKIASGTTFGWDMNSMTDLDQGDIGSFTGLTAAGGAVKGKTAGNLGQAYFGLNLGGRTINPTTYTKMQVIQTTHWDRQSVSQFSIQYRDMDLGTDVGSWNSCNSTTSTGGELHLEEGREVYTIDLSACPGWNNGRAKNQIRYLPAIPANYSFEVDRIAIYQPGATTYQIQWNNVTGGARSVDTEKLEVALYYNTTNAGSGGDHIASGLSPSGSYTWDVSGLGNGLYYIYAEAYNHVSPPQQVYAAGSLQIGLTPADFAHNTYMPTIAR